MIPQGRVLGRLLSAFHDASCCVEALHWRGECANASLEPLWTVVLTGSLIATRRTHGWHRSTLSGLGLTGDVKNEHLFLLWMDPQQAELHECYNCNYRRRLAFAIVDVNSGKDYIANSLNFTLRHGVVALCAQADSHVICHQLWMCEKGIHNLWDTTTFRCACHYRGQTMCLNTVHVNGLMV